MMKALKIMLLLFVLAICSNAQAQTKEETISWLKEKIEKYIQYQDASVVKKYEDFKLEKLDECSLIYSYTLYYDGKPNTHYRVVIPIDNISRIGDDGLVRMSVKSVKVELVKVEKEEKTSHYRDWFGHFRNGEENIYERLDKAFKHLATFCPKKTETF